MGMLERAEQSIRCWRRANLTKNAAYVCSAGTFSVPVTQAETRIDSDNGEVIVRSRVVDFIVDTCDMITRSQEIEPKPGDRVVLGDLVFELAALGDEPCYRPHGRDFKSLRLHTKQIGGFTTF